MPRSQLTVVLLLAALAAAAWLLWPRPDLGPVAAAPAATNAPPSSEPGSAQEAATDHRAPAAVTERNSVAATIAAGKALVRITTRSAAGQLQPGVMVRAQPQRGNRICPAIGSGLTDEHGKIEFADVEPGKLYLSTDRGDQKEPEIVPGLNEIDFEVKAGIDVTGRVLDPDGAPVADATVWLQTSSTGWDGGRGLGKTSEDGTFTLANVAPTCSLGAFASGFAPSALIDLEVVDQTTPPARIELRLLRDGGNLTGRVTDRTGAPIAGAQVAVGDSSQRANYQGNRVIEVWGVRCFETDRDGRYTIQGMQAGDAVVTARAAGFGIWRGKAEITTGATTTLDLTLERSAVLFGTVTDKDGAPEAGARISVYDREPGTGFLAGGQIDFDLPFGNREAVTDAHGNYRIEGVTPGCARLFAQRANQGGFGRGVSVAFVGATLAIDPGTEVPWNPVIDVGRSIAGIVRYHDGYPIPYLFITLHDERTGGDQVINSDREGAFRFLCLADSTYEVRVQPPFDAPRGNDPPRRSGIVPDRGTVEITVEYDKPKQKEPGTVSGRIVDAGGRLRNPLAATLTLNSDAGWFRPGIKVKDGAFRVEEVDPCRFRMVLKEDETVLASSDWFELVPAGNVDVGVLTTEPGGALRIHLTRARGAENFEPKLYLRRDGDPLSSTVAPGRDQEVLAASLTPGNYEVSGYCNGMMRVKAKATVNAGLTTELKVDLLPGATGKIQVWWPEQHQTSKQRGYKISDAAGNIVLEYEGPLSTMPTRPYELNFTLTAGQHHLEFWTDDGLRGGLDFEIPANLIAPALRLDLH